MINLSFYQPKTSIKENNIQRYKVDNRNENSYLSGNENETARKLKANYELRKTIGRCNRDCSGEATVRYECMEKRSNTVVSETYCEYTGPRYAIIACNTDCSYE